MFKIENGCIRLFRFAGIDVYLHWFWLVLAYIEVNQLSGKYQRPAWAVIEYVSIFGIVLLHEFGHALACPQVGGTANRIMLWPLGGIAFVNPPPRPGPMLWSIAAGPLVNVFLVPVTVGLALLSKGLDWNQSLPDLNVYLQWMAGINLTLLIFNLLPIYPTDGGQILQAILWFIIGRPRSLQVASVVGLVGGLGLMALSLWLQQWFLCLIAFFLATQAWAGVRQARILAQLAQMPRHQDLACPSCGAAPLKGAFWRCDQCETLFDTFEHGGVCPNCSQRFAETACTECHRRHPIQEWIPEALPAEPTLAQEPSQPVV